MKKFLLTAAAAMVLSTSAMGADLKMPGKAVAPPPPPSPWDVAFGASIASDYIWRGITQSNHRPSVSAYTELRYNSNPNLQWYAGISGSSISFPNQAALELDFYGGVRPTFGPLALDFGFWQYYYPGGQCYFGGLPGCSPAPLGNFVAKEDWHFYDIYAKGTWTVNDQWALGFNAFYSPNILNTGSDSTYVSGTVKFTAPSAMALWYGNVGWYASGEFGGQFLGSSDAFYGTGTGTIFAAGIPFSDYATWNAGLGFTYKVFTLDLRYYDTDLTAGECALYTSAHTAALGGTGPTAANPLGVTSNWCDARFVAKLSFDLSLISLK
jgi:hypothetical protein